eukprot:scaffold326773_cov52-Tisochrysis_lutea.AAC.2
MTPLWPQLDPTCCDAVALEESGDIGLRGASRHLLPRRPPRHWLNPIAHARPKAAASCGRARCNATRCAAGSGPSLPERRSQCKTPRGPHQTGARSRRAQSKRRPGPRIFTTTALPAPSPLATWPLRSFEAADAGRAERAPPALPFAAEAAATFCAAARVAVKAACPACLVRPVGRFQPYPPAAPPRSGGPSLGDSSGAPPREPASGGVSERLSAGDR